MTAEERAQVEALLALAPLDEDCDWTADLLAVTRDATGKPIGAFLGRRVEQDGQVVGLLEAERTAEGQALGPVLERLLEGTLPRALAPEGGGPAERLTLYYAAGLEAAQALRIGEELRRAHPDLEVEVLAGGQPGRGLIVGVE